MSNAHSRGDPNSRLINRDPIFKPSDICQLAGHLLACVASLSKMVRLSTCSWASPYPGDGQALFDVLATLLKSWPYPRVGLEGGVSCKLTSVLVFVHSLVDQTLSRRVDSLSLQVCTPSAHAARGVHGPL